MQTISPVSNLVTLLALLVIAIGASVRMRSGRPYGRDQLYGALLVILGTGIGLYLEYLLRLQIGAPPGVGLSERSVLIIWFMGWMTSTVGFIVFAWGYLSEALGEAHTGTKDTLPVSRALRRHGAGT